MNQSIQKKYLLFICIATTLLSNNLFATEPDFFIEFEFSHGIPSIIQIKKRLETIQSDYQTIEAYETEHFGNMLVIDGVVMLTQKDNFAYHEMIVHVPMNAHPQPKKVLIVGGGDGGTLKEVLRYSSVEEVVLCEIDPQVINISKKYFPEFSAGFDDPRLNLVIGDAAQYIKTKKNYFDIICVDSTDPIGPGQALFTKEFYHRIAQALTSDGIAVTQSESMFYSPGFIASLQEQNQQLFGHVAYYYTLVPTYPSGTIGFSFCSKKYNPFEQLDSKKIKQLGDLNYYSEAIHRASFQLPEFLHKRLNKKNN